MTFSIALAGLGSAADQLHLPALRALGSDVSLVGAADPSGERRDWGTTQGIPATFATVDEVLGLKPDVLIVGTPPETHRAICEQALAAGVHVFCEKPLTPTIVDADAIVAAADRAGRFVVVDNQYRHLPFYRATRDAIDSGAFGRPYLLQMWQQMDIPGGNYPAWKASLDRLVIYEFGTHAFDLIAYLLGGPNGPMAFGDAHPRAISTKVLRANVKETLDMVSVSRLDFPRDVVSTLTLNWRSHAPQRYLEARLDCEKASIRLSLGGVAQLRAGINNGVPDVRFTMVKGGEARVEQGGKSRVLAQNRAAGWVSGTANHLRQFLDAIKADRRPEGDAFHARELLRTALAAYDSAEMGGETLAINRPVPTVV